jgi:hypothetical protein
MDNNKIANILSTVSGLDTELVGTVIECVENGWDAEAIYNMNDREMANVLELGDVERIVADYNYWTNLGFNRVQVDYDIEVEDDNEEVEIVELVTEEKEELDVENVAPILQTMNMAEIYNEIVQERNQQIEVEDEVVPFNDVEDYDELLDDEFDFDDDELLDDEVEFDDDELVDDESEFDDDFVFDDDDGIEFDDDFVFDDDDGMEFDDDIFYDENIVDEPVVENVEEFVASNTVGIVTDVYNQGYLMATTKYGSNMPSVFEKVSDLSVFENEDGAVNLPRLVLDDTVGNDEVTFEDQDLLAILKVRVSSLLDLKNDEGELIFKDDKCLNNVLDKLTEAQMWLDLWTKLN